MFPNEEQRKASLLSSQPLSNIMGVAGEAGHAYLSGAPDVTLSFYGSSYDLDSSFKC